MIGVAWEAAHTVKPKGKVGTSLQHRNRAGKSFYRKRGRWPVEDLC